MKVGLLQVEIRFPEPQSLKEKRMLLKSLTSRIRNQFNVSVAEIDGMDVWQRSVLAIASVARENKQANEILNHVLDFIRTERRMELIDQQMEFF